MDLILLFSLLFFYLLGGILINFFNARFWIYACAEKRQPLDYLSSFFPRTKPQKRFKLKAKGVTGSTAEVNIHEALQEVCLMAWYSFSLGFLSKQKTEKIIALQVYLEQARRSPDKKLQSKLDAMILSQRLEHALLALLFFHAVIQFNAIG